jgi:hypothetical protein
VQFAALLAAQAAVKDCPAVTTAGLKVMCGAGGGAALYATSSTGLPGTTRLPVPPGSRTDSRVASAVLLVVSAVEVHTAASDVKSATPFEPFGAGGGVAGQAP